ncbi:FtsX-like permease family protein [Streptomyces sp. NPDC058665]|uniref:FtsX-like permease family protein n=1 Tax=Streptomyces sp. NPDC058665 TaxID=3346586 RepID=UPI00364C5B6E
MTGFVFLRVRAHRLLLAAALLAVLLTTCVLSALTAFSGSVGDAALRHTLQGREAAAAALVITAQVPAGDREAANEAASKVAREAFDGLPVTVRKLERSGSYALPRALQPPAARKGEPDLTHFATLDRSRVRLVTGAWPDGAEASGAAPVQVAFPEEAATQLGLKAGTRLTLVDRLGDQPLTIRVTGIYRPADLTDPYWKLDTVGGQGVQTVTFTTYGPLLADPALFDSGRLPAGDLSWLAAADFRSVTTGRIGSLRAAAERGPKSLAAQPVFDGGVTARTALPSVLDRTERALLVSRSTLLIVAVQLVLLAACALLLVARLLSTERTGETDLLRARGGSRRRIGWLATVEALLLALPAAICAPLLAGPLTRLLAERGALAEIGLRLGDTSTAEVWLTGAGVALACAAAVVAPALASAGVTRLRRGRAGTLPGPVRAGADVGLLVIAAVAYWQLDRQTATSGGGALSGDSRGELGVDPLLVAAPALALLAGTVLTLRLLPPLARLAERRAASGRGLSAALAGWQFSRRPLRGAGPVLLLVPAVAMGMLAIGQSASWDRSQEDQADFRTGASLRVLANRPGDPGQAGIYAALPGVREAAPAHRATTELSADRTATVLALDTGQAGERMLLRDDLAGGGGDGEDRNDDGAAPLLDAVQPPKTARPGLLLPDGTRQLRVTLRITDTSAGDGVSPAGGAPFTTVVVEDRYGIGYRMLAGEVPVDGRPHTVTLDLTGASDSVRGPQAASTPLTPAEPLTLTGLVLDTNAPQGRSETHRLSVDALQSLDAEGAARTVRADPDFAWQATRLGSLDGEADPAVPLKPAVSATAPLVLTYRTGVSPQAGSSYDPARSISVQVGVERPDPPAVLPAIATGTFLRAAGAKTGQSLDVQVSGNRVRVRIVRAVDQLPTTGPGALSAQAATETADGGRTGDGGGLLLDLRAVNRTLADRREPSLAPTEWWLSAAPGRAPEIAETLRKRSDVDPAQVMVRDETADELLSDPLGVGPQSALLAAAIAAAALAAVGFAVSAAGSVRERGAEFALLRALGTPRRQLARLLAAEQGLLLAVALLVGLALGAVLTRAVVPLVVLTGQATQPVPHVLVDLPAGQVAALLAGVSVLPLLLIVYFTLRRTDPAVTLRERGGN